MGVCPALMLVDGPAARDAIVGARSTRGQSLADRGGVFGVVNCEHSARGDRVLDGGAGRRILGAAGFRAVAAIDAGDWRDRQLMDGVAVCGVGGEQRDVCRLSLRMHRRESGNETTTSANKLAATATHGNCVTWRRMLAGLAAAVVVSIGVGAAAMVGVRLDDDTEMTAHRAGAAARPENSVAACEQAVRDGADWIEIDVQETSDGEVVVIHDRDLMKLGGSPLNVWESTAADLRAVDVGSSFDAKFSDVRLATLGEMLDAAKAGGIGVVIELKHYGHAQQLEERVAKIVEDHEMVDHIVIMSLDAASLKRMRELRPTWTIGRLTAVPVTDLTREQVEFLAVSTRMATPEFIRKAHARGKDVYVWTVNDAATMFEMTSRGADNLITDDPASGAGRAGAAGEHGADRPAVCRDR